MKIRIYKNMFPKNKQKEKGSAMIQVVILIANALVIVASIVFISAMQSKSTAAVSLTAEAFQQADSGLEYILGEINQINQEDLNNDDLDDICDYFDNGTGRCSINIMNDVTIFFLDEDEEVLDNSDTKLINIKYIKVLGEAKSGNNKTTRSLRATLFEDVQ